MQQRTGHISGLDTIRFIAALIVALGHLSIPFPDVGPLGRPFEVLWSNLFNGPAAVIVFFVLSGFVIHLPQVSRDVVKLDLQSYYKRRFIRIGLPSFAAVALYAATDTKLPGVLWSIICEAIYYGLYPFLLLLSQRFGWKRLVFVTTALTFVLSVTNLDLLEANRNGYLAFGYATWIIGLPMWLLGCWLAEHRFRFSVPTLSKLNKIRLYVFALSVVLRVVKFQVPEPWGSNVIWLTLFGFVVVYWLGCEIAYRRDHPAMPFWDKLGAWSFSLYLTHTSVIAVVYHLGISIATSTGLIILAVMLLFAYFFYIVVERPSHKAARLLGRQLSAKAT